MANQMDILTVDGESVYLDEEGFLLDSCQWTPAVADKLARVHGQQLNQQHWEIILFVQAYHQQYEITPPMRALVRGLKAKLGAEKANSRYLYRLFPDGPAKQATRYAGLPKPVSCI